MTQLPEDAVSASVRLTRPLEAADIPYAIGGAVAYGYWGVPRATVDVDLDLFVEEDRLDEAIDRLCEGGATIDKAAAVSSSRSPKDILDLERLVAVQGEGIDVDYVRRWIVDMLGEDDERVSQWDRIVGEHGARRPT